MNRCAHGWESNTSTTDTYSGLPGLSNKTLIFLSLSLASCWNNVSSVWQNYNLVEFNVSMVRSEMKWQGLGEFSSSTLSTSTTGRKYNTVLFYIKWLAGKTTCEKLIFRNVHMKFRVIWCLVRPLLCTWVGTDCTSFPETVWSIFKQILQHVVWTCASTEVIKLSENQAVCTMWWTRSILHLCLYLKSDLEIMQHLEYWISIMKMLHIAFRKFLNFLFSCKWK